MNEFGSPPNAVLMASLILLLTMLLIRRRRVQSPKPRQDRLDTVQSWPAQVVRAMTPLQLAAHDLLREALPGHLILVHTPLSQFMRVSTRNSYTEWYRRAGRLRTAFLVCDRQASVVAAVNLRLLKETEREQARHARLARVLESTGVPVLVWTEGSLPTLAQVRQHFSSLHGAQAQPAEAAAAVPALAATPMSGEMESMSVESTDFAALDSMPAALD